MQILKKFGAANLPVWYEAGKYAQDSSPIPFSEPLNPHHRFQCALPCQSSPATAVLLLKDRF